jgi:hypothetical protein
VNKATTIGSFKNLKTDINLWNDDPTTDHPVSPKIVDKIVHGK